MGLLFTLMLVLSTSQSLSTSGLLFHNLLYMLDGEPSIDANKVGEIKKPEAKKRLCPEGSGFFNETSSCQTFLEQGSCGDLQVFYPLWKDAEYGDCGCIFNDGCDGKVNRMALPSPDSKRKQCFWAFSKGPCQSGEWYILNLKTRKPECQKNPCCSKNNSDMKKSDSSPILKEPPSGNDLFTFVNNGTCYKTYTKGFCSEGQYVQFHGTNDPYPKCFSVKSGPPMCMMGVAPVVGMPCEAGYKQVGDDCVLANPEFE
jgi:hypothetical protein